MNVLHEPMMKGAFLPGVYDSYSNSAYHLMDAISKSDLDLIHKSPYHYRMAIRSETPAMKLGTALHCAVLEPERFGMTYIEVEGDRRTKTVKETIKAAEEAGRIVLTSDEMAAVQGMAASIQESQNFRTFSPDAVTEHSVFGYLEGVPVKCRPDMWVEKYNVLIDLKTTEDASPQAFAKSCRRYRYHVQDAFYRHVISAATGVSADDMAFGFCVVEKQPPYAVAWYEIDAPDTERGWLEALADLGEYKDAKEHDDWKGYSNKIVTISLFGGQNNV